MMDHTKEEYLSWFKCRSVGESFTSDDWVARDLMFAEIARLREAATALNEAVDAMWNDHDRVLSGRVREHHLAAITKAQQALAEILK